MFREFQDIELCDIKRDSIQLYRICELFSFERNSINMYRVRKLRKSIRDIECMNRKRDHFELRDIKRNSIDLYGIS